MDNQFDILLEDFVNVCKKENENEEEKLVKESKTIAISKPGE